MHPVTSRVPWGPEYYNVGHDEPMSILNLPIDEDELPHLKLDALTSTVQDSTICTERPGTPGVHRFGS